MRWTKATVVPLLTLPALACGKSLAQKLADIRACTAITMDAKGAAQCLVLQYKWKQKDADSAATAFQRQQDSVAQFKADSTWRADASRHRREIAQCATDPSGEVTRCLLGYGWADARAKGTADSVWRHGAPQHRVQMLSCTRQRKMQTGACLQLYYKWSPERAQVVDDSMRRAKMAKTR